MKRFSFLFVFMFWAITLNAQSIKKLYNSSYVVKTNTTFHVNEDKLYNSDVIIIFADDTITMTDGDLNQTVFTVLNKTIVNKNEIYYQSYVDLTNRPVKIQIKKDNNTFYVFVEISGNDQLFLFKTDNIKSDLKIGK
jgi:hypothetical protein